MSDSTQHKRCYVVRKRPYRETSLLLDLLTADSVHVAAVQRGALRKRQGAPDLLAEYEMSWRGSQRMVTITRCDFVRDFKLRGKSLYAALYLNELVLRATRHGAVVDNLFDTYTDALIDLESQVKLLDGALRCFERELLRGLGYELVLGSEMHNGAQVDPEGRYSYVVDEGLRRCESDRSSSYGGRELLAISQDDYSDIRARRTAKRIYRQALRFHLGARPFHARALFTAA